jgi:hypothetical protein
MTRTKHLQWCKDRAIQYLDKGDVAQGMASFTSDMSKHPETNETLQNGLSHPIIMQALMTNNSRSCIECINGFK